MGRRVWNPDKNIVVVGFHLKLNVVTPNKQICCQHSTPLQVFPEPRAELTSPMPVVGFNARINCDLRNFEIIKSLPARFPELREAKYTQRLHIKQRCKAVDKNKSVHRNSHRVGTE